MTYFTLDRSFFWGPSEILFVSRWCNSCLYTYVAELYCVCFWRDSSQWARASSFMKFLDHTQRRTTGTPLDEWLARRKDLYLTTHNTHNRYPPMPPVGFEPTISAGEQPPTYALDRAANETGGVVF